MKKEEQELKVQQYSNIQIQQIAVSNEESKKNSGTWFQIQQIKYIIFLQIHKKQLQSRQKRKNHKIFKQMAKFIQTRNGIQCRSHHMKLLRTHSKIRKIITHVKKVLKIQPESKLYSELFSGLRNQTIKKEEKPLMKKLKKKSRQNVQNPLLELNNRPLNPAYTSNESGQNLIGLQRETSNQIAGRLFWTYYYINDKVFLMPVRCLNSLI